MYVCRFGLTPPDLICALRLSPLREAHASPAGSSSDDKKTWNRIEFAPKRTNRSKNVTYLLAKRRRSSCMFRAVLLSRTDPAGGERSCSVNLKTQPRFCTGSVFFGPNGLLGVCSARIPSVPTTFTFVLGPKRVRTGSFDNVLLLLSLPGAHEEYDGKTQPSNSER